MAYWSHCMPVEHHGVTLFNKNNTLQRYCNACGNVSRIIFKSSFLFLFSFFFFSLFFFLLPMRRMQSIFLQHFSKLHLKDLFLMCWYNNQSGQSRKHTYTLVGSVTIMHIFLNVSLTTTLLLSHFGFDNNCQNKQFA